MIVKVHGREYWLGKLLVLDKGYKRLLPELKDLCDAN